MLAVRSDLGQHADGAVVVGKPLGGGDQASAVTSVVRHFISVCAVIDKRQGRMDQLNGGFAVRHCLGSRVSDGQWQCRTRIVHRGHGELDGVLSAQEHPFLGGSQAQARSHIALFATQLKFFFDGRERMCLVVVFRNRP